MLLAIAEREMTIFGLIRLTRRTVVTGTNDPDDDCVTISTQDERNGALRHSPVFTSRYGKTKDDFINEVREKNQFDISTFNLTNNN